jgi:hypothetical protein
MSTLIDAPRRSGLPAGAVAVRHGWLLAGVNRPCLDHPGAGSCPCVATTREGRMVFWCDAGDHHFTARASAPAGGN